MPAKCKINRVHSRTKLNFRARTPLQASLAQKQSSLSSDSNSSSCSKSAKLQQAHIRRGRRTNLHINRHRGSTKTQKVSRMSPKNKRIHLHLISQQYKRKMSDVMELSDEQHLKKRKISWGQESQFVTFDKNTSIDSIREAPRHKFSIDL